MLRGGNRDAGLVRDAALNARPPPEFQCVNSCGYVDNHSASRYDPVELIGGQLIVAEPKGLYARAGIVDYWIVNLVDRVLEVYRDPGADVTAPYGWRYTSVQRFTPPSAVAPLEIPAAPISVAALLP